MTEPAVPPAVLVATDVIRVSVTPDDVGNHARMLDLSQQLHESNGLNAGEEVLPSRMKAVASTTIKLEGDQGNPGLSLLLHAGMLSVEAS